ncbi:unnamed protein product [Peronospora belbahrii]|uniref:COQ9 domain-containing protein n=1 Tax=Peronospora belbahrii TaxID=622444 RepID=A0ABN8CPR5_9STRA|nr:unnamed protein product [Peronospora belbahrii]
MHKLIISRRLSILRSNFTASVQPNWLEKNCGDVPVHPQPHDLKASEMLRGGHVLQVASAKMLEATVNFNPIRAFSSTHTKKLKQLYQAENKAVQRLEDAVKINSIRFRPSLMIPALELSSFIVGSVLSTLGDKISTSYVTGVKTAVSDYYNDQIREIYATSSDMDQLKELFKVARDEEQEISDIHTPDMANPNDGNSDPIATVAKASVKVLVQVAKFV